MTQNPYIPLCRAWRFMASHSGAQIRFTSPPKNHRLFWFNDNPDCAVLWSSVLGPVLLPDFVIFAWLCTLESSCRFQKLQDETIRLDIFLTQPFRLEAASVILCYPGVLYRFVPCDHVTVAVAFTAGLRGRGSHVRRPVRHRQATWLAMSNAKLTFVSWRNM